MSTHFTQHGPQHRRYTMILSAVLLSGCGQIQELKDTVSELTNSFVIEGMFLGIAEPDDPTLAEALASGAYASGAEATVFLADALSLNEVENAPIMGQVVGFELGGNTKSMWEEGDGKYVLSGDDGIDYTAGMSGMISVRYEDTVREVAFVLPAAPALSIPETHTAGEPLVLNMAGQGYSAMQLIVVDVLTGMTVFSNEPQSIGEFYQIGHGDGAELQVEIPGIALSNNSIYAIGVAGIEASEEEDFSGVNASLSTMLIGQFAFTTMCTIEPVELCDAI